MLRCSVVAVGTELLLGQVVDTNTAYIGERLAEHGVASHVHVKVGDNLARVVAALRVALADHDAVIVCGGLGPTHDDLTREAIAELAGVELVRDEAVASAITEMFQRRGRYMSPNNLRQADVPVGGTVIDQRIGTAPGLICDVVVDGRPRVVYAVPGVPIEMREMLDRAILPDLHRRAGDSTVIASRTLRTWGESESALNERLDPLIGELDQLGNPTLAFLASGWEGLKVRLTAQATSLEGATSLLDEWEQRLLDVISDLVFGVDEQTMESVVLDALRTRGWTLGLAESLTGGLVCGRLTGVPGASEVVRGSVVSYASEVKFDVLGVPLGPVVTEGAARDMAIGARRVLGADVGLALTGVAGPGEQEGLPVGTVFVAVATPSASHVRRFLLPGARQQVRELSVINALDMLRRVCADHRGFDHHQSSDLPGRPTLG